MFVHECTSGAVATQGAREGGGEMRFCFKCFFASPPAPSNAIKLHFRMRRFCLSPPPHPRPECINRLSDVGVAPHTLLIRVYGAVGEEKNSTKCIRGASGGGGGRVIRKRYKFLQKTGGARGAST